MPTSPDEAQLEVVAGACPIGRFDVPGRARIFYRPAVDAKVPPVPCGAAYGVVFTLAGYELLLLAVPQPYVLTAAVSGFMLAVPMLVDREIDVLTAIPTSLEAVRQDPAAMTLWAVWLVALCCTLTGNSAPALSVCLETTAPRPRRRPPGRA